jgi:hypothetical protein
VNPEDRETLFVIAEVGVAFAGFASIVSVLARRSGSDSAYLDASRLRGMLFSSLSAVALCFVPLVPFQYGLSAEVAWRISGGALIVGSGLPFLRGYLDYRIFSQAGVVPGLAIRITVIALCVVPALMGLGLLLGFADSATYITGVLLLLASAGIGFARLILSFSSPAA